MMDTPEIGRAVADQSLPGAEPVEPAVARRSGSAPSRAGEGAAWVNWNPDPDIHTLDRVLPRGVAIATCGVTVRKQLPEPFDPTHPKACQDCAAGRKRPLDLDRAIVCTRVAP